MASNYPTSVDNTTDVADGVDIVEAIDVNTVKDSAEAAQTVVGALGASTAKATDLVAQMIVSAPQIKLSYVDADTIQASAGVVWCQNSGATIRLPRKNTSTTNITFADLDTSTEANSTTYFVHASADATATTVTFKISTSSTAPTGLTTFRLIGGFYNDSSGDVVEKSVWSAGGMRVVNSNTVTYSTYSSGTTVIPYDDSIPQQSTDGDEYFSIDYIPQSTTNILVIDVKVHCTLNASNNIAVVLFQDSTENAIATTGHILIAASGSSINPFSIHHVMAAGTVSKTTFKVFGGGASGTFFINGDGTARRYGGSMSSYITVTEYEV